MFAVQRIGGASGIILVLSIQVQHRAVSALHQEGASAQFN